LLWFVSGGCATYTPPHSTPPRTNDTMWMQASYSFIPFTDRQAGDIPLPMSSRFAG
jgi:hypothetical protein